jgi:hypothetical protein
MKQDDNKKDLITVLYQTAYNAEVLSIPTIVREEDATRLISEGVSPLKRWDLHSGKYN